MPATELPPVISLLVAARNEESTILKCLRAIAQLDYPADAIEVLIGDDQSTDQTTEVVTQFIDANPRFCLVTIIDQQDGLQGKANVLAQLARLARGQYLFFTDADTQVPTGWLQEMSRYLTENVGIVTGVTLPEGPALFHKLQA
ncbi:MAG: glycosyl transferase family 2, partial [Spirosoma sp.]|nr:glycosyl transferase family 2 [Spirosoma sp.]